MSRTEPPFDPNAFAQWLLEGVKDVVQYRARQTLDRERWIEFLKSRIPNQNQVLHLALKRAFTGAGFAFEELSQGEAVFHLIRKRWRDPAPGTELRRILFIPGFGDTPGSWLPLFTLSQKELADSFDELLVIDFPGYTGFLSHHPMVTSMRILLATVATVCEANPPSALLGHSLGGWLAAKVAQDLPRTLDHLLLIAPSGLIPPEERKTFGDFIVKNQNLTVPELLELVVFNPRKFGPLLSKEFGDFYSKPGIREFVESVEERHFVDPAKPVRARKITTVWGDHDRFVPTHWQRHWIETYGECLDAYLLKDTGHIPQMEHPYVTSRVILHALLEKGGVEGRGWKKVQSRQKINSAKEGAREQRARLPGQSSNRTT